MNYPRLNDSKNRQIDYLRVSITDRCNLRCVYCTPEGRIPKLSHDDVLRYEEILRLVKIGNFFGIKKVRITGGEPLTRKGVFDFIQQLSLIKGLKDLSLTTNGVLLSLGAEKIKNAGISRINVSLDSLNPSKYKYITGYDEFDKVWDGIMLVHELGFDPVKINVVAMKGLNDDELVDFAKLSFFYPFCIRFIEYMPIGISQIKSKYQILTPEIKDKLSAIGALKPIEKGINDGPAERFKFSGAMGEIGFISALSHPFCQNCNRLRLTSEGCLRSCLLSDRSFSTRDLIRNGCSDEELHEVFREAVFSKSSRHSLFPNEARTIVGQMCNIGG